MWLSLVMSSRPSTMKGSDELLRVKVETLTSRDEVIFEGSLNSDQCV